MITGIVYKQHLIVGNYSYKPFYIIYFTRDTKYSSKINFTISAEHALQYGDIGSRIILYVDVIILTEKEYWLISAMNCAIFGWLFSF